MIVKRRKSLLLLIAALALTGAVICAAAQNKVTTRPAEKKVQDSGAKAASTNASPHAETDATEADAPHYSYEFEQPEFAVHHIKLEHDGRGRGQVLFERRTDSEPIVEPLQLSEAALQRINALWEALHFLDSDTNYQSSKSFANIGTTRLRMTRGKRERTAEFNYSHDRDAFALADEYRRAAEQVMFVFEIEVARENQPLDAPKLLSRLDTAVTRGGLSDPQQLIPLLRELNTDERLPLIARNQAGRLLKRLEK